MSENDIGTVWPGGKPVLQALDGPLPRGAFLEGRGHHWKLAWLVLMPTVLAPLLVLAQEARSPILKRVISLEGEWRCHPGDNLSWASPSYDDSSWSRIQAPLAWGRQGYSSLTKGWYRKTLFFDESKQHSKRELGIWIGDVRSAYELYTGGELVGAVGRLPPDGVMEFDRYRLFSVPRSAASEDGKLVLALRVWCSPAEGRNSGGLVAGPLQFGEIELLSRRAALSDLPRIGLVIFLVLMAAQHLLLYRRRPYEQAHPWLSIFLFTAAVYLFLTTSGGSSWATSS